MSNCSSMRSFVLLVAISILLIKPALAMQNLTITAKTESNCDITLTATAVFDTCEYINYGCPCGNQTGSIQLYRDQYDEVLCLKTINSGGSCIATIKSGKYSGTHEFYADLSGDCLESFAGPKVINFDSQSCCDLTVNLDVSPSVINSDAGGEASLAGSVSSTKPFTWTLTTPKETLTGSGSLPAFSWDGTLTNGELAPSGFYSVTFSAHTDDGTCSDSKSVQIEVIRNKSCSMNMPANSSVNAATGNLTDMQPLFSAKGVFPVDISLSYASRHSMSGSPLGKGWTHSLDITLKENTDGSVLIREATAERLYALSGSIYTSRTQDFSSLVKNVDGSFTLTELQGEISSFNSSGRIVTKTDHNGNNLIFTYSGANLTEVNDAARTLVSFIYNETGNVSEILDSAGNQYTFGYEIDLLTSRTNPDGGTWRYTYNSDGYMETKIDPEANLITYVYQSKRLTSTTDPTGKVRNYTYPPDTTSVRSTTFTEKDGGIWTYTYNTTTGTLTSKTDPVGNTISYTYDVNRNMLSMTEPLIGTTSYTYDVNNNMTSNTDPLGNVTSYTYSSRNQVLTSVGPQGTTSNIYDSNGNLLTTTDSVGATTTYEYNAHGNVTKITNALNQAITMTYSSVGLLASTTDPLGNVVLFTYDTNGNLQTSTNAANKMTSYTYDSMNRLITVTDPLNNITTYGYDKLGNRTSVTDANGAVTTYKYNYHGQLTESKDALGTTTYSYGPTGCPSCGGGADKLTKPDRRQRSGHVLAVRPAGPADS